MAENKGINALPMKYKIALLALCPLLIIALCSGTIILYAGTLVEEGVYTPPAEQVAYLSEAPESNENRLTAANKLLATAQQCGETQITGNTSVDLHDLTSDLNEAQTNLLLFASGSIESGMAGMTENKSLTYGETADLFPALASDKIDLAQDTVFTYTAEIENPFTHEDGTLIAKTEETFATALTVDKKEITLTESKADLTLDPVTDRLQNVTYTRTYHMDYTVTFIGDLSALGTKTLAFDCTLTSRYDIAWAGITIGQSRISLDKTGYQALNLTVNKAADAPADSYSLTFVSSDESIVTVDEQGVVEAVVLSDKKVTVTATLEYLGKTYTDSCEVLVIIQPESVKMHSKAQTLQIGETTQLSASVEPEKASIKTIIWYSPDESVATVDENGVVTAVGEGKVQIIAVSEIGTYMAGCNITVEGGA
ncbi:MAG: Ig domain-containing protein [Clostridia bacterium]|nr:Ig domain-containing protein [Clostridia bacterium]